MKRLIKGCAFAAGAFECGAARCARGHMGLDHLPAGEGAQARVVPIYETIEGWKEPTANARSWANLPAQAIKYVRRVEELVGCPIALLSTSPEREDTILVQNPFEA